jgi:arginyl-tRNA--protein-N-Asp/Glu arginylyltransferase
MKISKESLGILKDKLPRGSVQKIRTRLINKGNRFSQQYIYRCLDPAQHDYNATIIDEAILLGEEMTKRIEEKEERVAHLRKVG